MMIDFVISLLRTWGHILVGVGIISIAVVASAAMSAWINSIREQIDDERDSQGRPQPWRYQ